MSLSRRRIACCAFVLAPGLLWADLWVKLHPGTPHSWMRGLPTYGTGERPRYGTEDAANQGHAVSGYGNGFTEEAETGGRPESQIIRRAMTTSVEAFMGDSLTHTKGLFGNSGIPPPAAAPPVDEAYSALFQAMMITAEIEDPAKMNPPEAVNFLVSLDTLPVPFLSQIYAPSKERLYPRPMALALHVLERVSGLKPDPHDPNRYASWWAQNAAAAADLPKSVKDWEETFRWACLKELSEGRYRQRRPFGDFIRENAEATLDPLLEIVQDKGQAPLIRRNAAGFVSEIISPKARKALRELAGSPDAVIRTRALSALVAQRDEDALPLFRVLLTGKDVYDAALAAEGIGLLADKASVPALLKLWNGGQGEMAVSALEALVRIGSPDAKDVFASAPKACPFLKPLARAGLIRLGEGQFIKGVRQDIVFGDVDWVPFDTVWGLYQAEAMAGTQEGRELLWNDTAQFTTGSDLLRVSLLAALPNASDPVWAQRLDDLVRNARLPAMIRAEALSKLGAQDHAKAEALSEELLPRGASGKMNDDDRSSLLRAVLQSLPPHLSPKTAKAARELAAGSSADLALEALRALAKDRTPETAALMASVLGNPKAAVALRLRAARHLGIAGGKAAASALVAALADREPLVRVQAGLALETLSGKKRFEDLVTTAPKVWKAFQTDWQDWVDKAKLPQP